MVVEVTGISSHFKSLIKSTKILHVAIHFFLVEFCSKNAIVVRNMFKFKKGANLSSKRAGKVVSVVSMLHGGRK